MSTSSCTHASGHIEQRKFKTKVKETYQRDVDAKESREAGFQGRSHCLASRAQQVATEAYAKLGTLCPREAMGANAHGGGRTNQNPEELTKGRVFSYRTVLCAWLLMQAGGGGKAEGKLWSLRAWKSESC